MTVFPREPTTQEDTFIVDGDLICQISFGLNIFRSGLYDLVQVSTQRLVRYIAATWWLPNSNEIYRGDRIGATSPCLPTKCSECAW